jgi:hypothetical protein
MEEDEDEQTLDAIEKSSGQNLAIEAPSSNNEHREKRENDEEIAGLTTQSKTNDNADTTTGYNSV